MHTKSCTLFFLIYFFCQKSGFSCWRVCYQRCLPCLVLVYNSPLKFSALQYRSLECFTVQWTTSITWPALEKGYSATLLLGVGENSISFKYFTPGHIYIYSLQIYTLQKIIFIIVTIFSRSCFLAKIAHSIVFTFYTKLETIALTVKNSTDIAQGSRGGPSSYLLVPLV